MNHRFDFSTGAFILPCALAEHAQKATARDLRVILTLAADPYWQTDEPRALENCAARLSLTPQTLEAALSFWRGAGVLQNKEQASPTPPAEEKKAENTEGKTLIIPEKGLPVYSADEMHTILETDVKMQELLTAAQQVFGKIFNAAEFSIVIGMVDHLRFDGEYVLMILSHCRKMNKRSLRYAEKMALSLYDEGITDAAVLEERLRRVEMMAQTEGKIRAMFGLGQRQLTGKEKKAVEKWVTVMNYPMDVLQKAYEITVDSTKEHIPSITYANAILERWYAAGYRTLADVEAALSEYKKQKTGSSFDIDEFVEAALKRAYEE